MRQFIIQCSRAIFGWPPKPGTFEEKKALITRMAREHGIKCFVETGTFRGEMIDAQLDVFEQFISIELSPELYQACCRKFANQPQVRLHQGDSGVKLREVTADLAVPALFWLDAHYSRGHTAGAKTEAPIIKELSCIVPRHRPDDLILIDDARLFGLKWDYPKLEEVRNYAAQHWPQHVFSVQNDVICIVPAR